MSRKKRNKIYDFKIPDTAEEIAETRAAVIESYLDGNELRFYRRLSKYYYYQLSHSVTIRRWKKNCKECYDYMYKELKWPKHRNDVSNIMRCMHDKYDWELNLNNLKRARIIWEYLSDEGIWEYMHKKYINWVKYNGIESLIPTEKQAKREHKYRGFIDVNDFEGFRIDYAHAFSNVNKYMVYPCNFPHGYGSAEDKDMRNPSAYIGHNLVGIMGWTRVEVPSAKKFNVRKPR